MSTDTVTPDDLLALSDVARRLGVSRTAINNAARGGAFTFAGTDSSMPGRPRRLIRWGDALAWAAAKDAAAMERRSPAEQGADLRAAERAAGIPLPGTPIGMQEASRKYGVSSPLISYWKKTGKVQVLREAEGQWEPDELDERSVLLQVQVYRAKQLSRGPAQGRSLLPGETRPGRVSPSRRDLNPPLGSKSRRRARTRGSWTCPHCGAEWQPR